MAKANYLLILSSGWRPTQLIWENLNSLIIWVKFYIESWIYNKTRVRDGSGYPFCLWINVNLEKKCSGQKDNSGQPDPLVFCGLENFDRIAKRLSKNKGIRPNIYFYQFGIWLYLWREKVSVFIGSFRKFGFRARSSFWF